MAQTPMPINDDQGNSKYFSPNGMIFIPNYDNNKAKIIKMADLASVVPIGKSSHGVTDS